MLNESPKLAVVTGAFSYTGKYVTRILLQRGYKVRTLTAHPDRPNEFGAAVRPCPYNFEEPNALQRSLNGASILVNTYWVRFPKGRSTFQSAIDNTKILFNAAKAAGVRRVVHVSIANPSLNSRLGYYRGKAILETALLELGVPHSIVRPTVIFGREDILINNIAWFVRKFPVFGIPGDGEYRIRLIYVEDIAALLANAAEQEGNQIIDAVGPETFAFEELVRTIAANIARSPVLVHLPVPIAHAATSIVGRFVGDIILTKQEYEGLMDGLLAPAGPATGHTRLSDWLAANGDQLGVRYTSEVTRHF